MNTTVFDFMNIFHRGLHVNAVLTHRGVFTGALYGMVNSIASAVLETNAERIYICNDARPYFREELYPTYKDSRRSREYTPEQKKTFAQGQKQCAEFFDCLGIEPVAVEGLEADDLIAAIAKRCHNTVGVSNDTDLYQLLGIKGFCLYRGKQKGYYFLDDFLDEFGVPPELWASVTAHAGSHNGMPGIPNVGVKTAIKILTNRQYRKSKRALLEEYADLVLTNTVAAELPYVDFDWGTLKLPSGKIRYNYRKLVAFLGRHGIKITTTMREAFEKING